MAWPLSTGLNTTNLDAGTDSPASARADLKVAVDKLKDALDSRGQPDGVCPLDASGRIPRDRLPEDPDGEGLAQMMFAPRHRVYGSAGTFSWPVPSGVTRVYVKLWGGGGGGGYAASGTAGGGGNGGGVFRPINVEGADEIAVVVGAGGTAGTAGAAPGAGGNTTVTVDRDGVVTTLTANGGAGGKSSIGTQSGEGGNPSDLPKIRGADGFADATGGFPGQNGEYGFGGKGSVGGTAAAGNSGGVIILF